MRSFLIEKLIPCFLLLTIVPLSCSQLDKERNKKKSGPSKGTGSHLVASCNIFSMDGKRLRSFPGQQCLFLEDGSFVSATNVSLRRFDNTGAVLWEIPGHFHHQVNLTEDRKRILALSSKIQKMKHKKIFREDRFLVLDLDGKVLHEQLASKLFEQTKTTPLDWPINAADASVIGKGIEISHFNSFYEIPKIEMGNPPHYLKQGNFIVNGHSSGVYILSSDLKEVLHYFTWEESCEHAIHDVQVTKRGHILLFNNRTFNHGCDFTRIFTTIVEVDPVHKNILHKFVDSPPRNFYAHGMGSVQEVDEDTWLFSHPSTGTYIYSKSKDKIFLKIPSTHMREGKPIPTQQSKLQDLSSFLSFWNQDF